MRNFSQVIPLLYTVDLVIFVIYTKVKKKGNPRILIFVKSPKIRNSGKFRHEKITRQYIYHSFLALLLYYRRNNSHFEPSAPSQDQMTRCDIYRAQIVQGQVKTFPALLLISIHPLRGGGDFFFLLKPPAAVFCFCSHSKNPARIISKYLQYAYWPWGICLVIFFLRSSNKIHDGRQNPMLLSGAFYVSEF